MLELYYICNLESCLSAQHRRLRSSKASVSNGCSTPFWGMLTYGATLRLLIIWSASSVLLLRTEERCIELEQAVVSAIPILFCPTGCTLNLHSGLNRRGLSLPVLKPPSPAVKGCWGYEFRFSGLLCMSHFTIHWSLQSSPFITALLCLFNKHSQGNPFILS